jgi:hypothetical protein
VTVKWLLAGSTGHAGREPASDESAPTNEHRNEQSFEKVMVPEPAHEEPFGDNEHDDEAEYSSDHAPEHSHGVSLSEAGGHRREPASTDGLRYVTGVAPALSA